MFSDLSSKRIIQELASRIKLRRLNLNWTQSDLAKKSGVHVQTIKKFELGQSSNLKTFIQILRALGELNALDRLIPETEVSPIELLKLKGKERERASGKGREDNEESEW